MFLKKAIFDIVEDHSGGVKFTKLITEVVKKVAMKQINGITLEELTPELIEDVVRKTPDLYILTYKFRPLKREKMFVYTK